MRITIDRLRRWLLLGIVLVVVAVVGVIGFARWKTRSLLHTLPRQLGADIRSETSGFTYSQSLKGHTLFTIHASKAIQKQNGKMTLRNASILLYGRDATSGTQRTDRIEGNEFEYDQVHGVAQAQGEVRIDLQSLSQPGTGKDGHVHLKTSGVVFTQSTGIARTDQHIDLEQGPMHGNAMGAVYDNQSGLLKLLHDVTLRMDEGPQAGTLLASYAELDRTSRQARLQRLRYQSGKKMLSGDSGVVQMRSDNSPERLNVDGDVEISDGSTVRLFSPHAMALLSTDRRPTQADLTGGVAMQGDAGEGRSEDASLLFDAAGKAQRVSLHGHVVFAKQAENQRREIASERMEVSLVRGLHNHTVVHELQAFDSVRMTMRGDGTPRFSTTVITADTMTGSLASADGRQFLQHCIGTGHVRVETNYADGEMRQSRSDTAEMWMLPVPGKAEKNHVTANSVDRIVQDGHVQLVSFLPANAKRRKASEMHAAGTHMEYFGATETARLTGMPHVEGDGMAVSATQIAAMQKTGDVEATGDVRAAYDSGSTQGVMHVIAEHALMHRSSDTASFLGTKEERVRLWQGASQLEAPRVEVDRTSQRLHAYSDSTWKVRMTAPVDSGKSSAHSGTQKGGSSTSPSTVLITGSDLVYRGMGSNPTGRFQGEVEVRQQEGTVRSDVLTATWATVSADTKEKVTAPHGEMFGGNLQTLLAEGDVRLLQGGRQGAGSRLLYTAETREFLLTGTPERPPVVTDSLQGKLTGASLRFRAGENSIVVTAAPGNRVHMETHLQR